MTVLPGGVSSALRRVNANMRRGAMGILDSAPAHPHPSPRVGFSCVLYCAAVTGGVITIAQQAFLAPARG